MKRAILPHLLLVAAATCPTSSAAQVSMPGPLSPREGENVENVQTARLKVTNLINWIGVPSAPDESLIVITSDTEKQNPAGCSFSGYYRMTAASDVSRSMLLTAIATKADVTLVIYSGGCLVNSPQIVAVGLYPP